MAQKIKKAKTRRRFTVVDNESLAQNKNLSYEALGLAVYLTSLPGDWEIVLRNLRRPGCGRDKLARIVAELVKSGHLVVEKLRSDKGRYCGVDYTFYEVPALAPETDYPETVKPDAAQPDTEDPQLQKTLFLTKELIPPATPQNTQQLPVVVSDVLDRDGERLVLKFGLVRVAEVCRAAQGKLYTKGFALSALRQGWEVRSAAEIEKSVAEDPARYLSGEFADFVES